MNLRTRADIQMLMDAPRQTAALLAALELGLFWRLADGPQEATTIAQEMAIPLRRCDYWLRLLVAMNLLEQEDQRFGLSIVARTAIMDAYSQETWKMLAIDAADNLEDSLFLAQRLTDEAGDGQARARLAPYVQKMADDLDRARMFGQMLYELHTPLANAVAAALELNGARSLMDVGGGSGVISLALLRKYPELNATVVDLPNVCMVGREFVDRQPEGRRIAHYPANFVEDELPKGFDIVLECDVGYFDDTFLTKLAASLNEGGRLVIVDRWFKQSGQETAGRLAYLLMESLRDPTFSLRSLKEIAAGLSQAGLVIEAMNELPYNRWKMIQARKVGQSV